MGLHFDRARTTAKHHDAALMAMLPGYGELEAIYPCKAALATCITDQPESAKGYVAVKQFYIHLLAVLPHRPQRPLANAIGMPQPGADAEQHQDDKQIAEGHHA